MTTEQLIETVDPPQAVPNQSALAVIRGQVWMLALFLAVTAGIYCTTLLLTYGFNDDYGLLDQAIAYPRQIYLGLAAQGRPFFGAAIQFGFSHMRTLNDLWMMRAVGLLGLALTAWALDWAARRAGWSRLTSSCVAIVAITLPPVQIYASWASFMPAPWALLAATLAGLLAGWILDGKPWRYLLSPIAVVLLVAAVITYQPAAMVFVAVMLLDVFSPAHRDDPMGPAIGRLVFFQAINAAALYGGFNVFQWGMRSYPSYRVEGRTGLAADFRHRPAWFVRRPLVNALNMWNVQATPRVAVIVGSVLIVGLLLYFRGKWWQRILGVLALPVSHLPNLLAEESDSYRTQVGLNWTVLVLALLAVTGIWNAPAALWRRRSVLPRHGDKDRPLATPLPRGLLVLLTAAASASAAYTSTRYITWPHALELAVLRIQLANPPASSARHLVFLQISHWNDTAAPSWISDDVGCPSIANAWAWEPQGAVFMVQRETNPNVERRDIRMVSFLTGPYTEALPPDTAVIDMRRMDAAR
jgi:hypothetical protein